MQMIEPALTVPQVAKHWGIAKNTVYKLVEDGKLTHIRFGRTIRIRPEHMREYEEQCIVTASNVQKSMASNQTSGMSSGLKRDAHSASQAVTQTNSERVNG